MLQFVGRTLKQAPFPSLPLNLLNTLPLNSPVPLPWSLPLFTTLSSQHPSFISDFSHFLTQLCATSPSFLLLGDFNFHIEHSDCKSTTEFLELQRFNFTQHANVPNHRRGHILDLVCSTGITIHQLSCLNLTISDHLPITIDINLPMPSSKHKCKILFRSLKSISHSARSVALNSKLSAFPPPLPGNLSGLVNHYKDILSSFLDQLAPITTKPVTFTHLAP